MKSIGIIGSGYHYKKNIHKSLLKIKGIKILAVLSRRKVKKIFKVPVFNEKEFFKKKMDFVYISTPNKLHFKFIKMALKNNVNVICEKPFCDNLNQTKKIIKYANDKKKLIFECFMYAYHPVFLYLKQNLHKKEFGKLRYVVSNFKIPSLMKSNNRYKKNSGSGFFLDLASYLLSLETYLFSNEYKKIKILKKNTIINKVPLRGSITFKSKKFDRFYFWGEGSKYSNNIELVYDKITIFIENFFSKKINQTMEMRFNGKKKAIKKFNKTDHFYMMFKSLFKNLENKSIKSHYINLILNHALIMNKVEKQSNSK